MSQRPTRPTLLAALAATALLSMTACSKPATRDAATTGTDTESAPTAAADTTFTFRRGVNISHWLSQLGGDRTYGADWFDEEDVAWIAAQGFDHLRLPVDGRLWLREDGTLDTAKTAPFERAMGWARQHGLGTILDMHFLPGADFNPDIQDNTLFTDPEKMQRVAAFWRQVAERYAGEGPWLRFELLNEPVAAENDQVNTFNRVMIAAIRESNPTRPIYITSNRWSHWENVKDVDMTDDPNVFLTFHFYEPFIFTHQRASWASMPPDMPIIPFPGTVPDLSGYFEEGAWQLEWSGRELTIEEHIEKPFAAVEAWVREHAAGREVLLGEFGAYLPASAESKRAYTGAVRAGCEARGWGWAVWDYMGGFAVRDPQGNPTPILEGLFPPEAAK
ncbi:MAG: hypothetical protein D6781_11130 [Verrucomicrobia bacterium]|nr:MAG: hypothetical protein D6781_11130 [Verrucomicrobiota bacterium]